MNSRNRKLQKRKNLKDRHRPGCLVTKSHTSWCYSMCIPIDGMGACGRPAPHGLRGRTDRAIEAYRKKKQSG